MHFFVLSPLLLLCCLLPACTPSFIVIFFALQPFLYLFFFFLNFLSLLNAVPWMFWSNWYQWICRAFNTIFYESFNMITVHWTIVIAWFVTKRSTNWGSIGMTPEGHLRMSLINLWGHQVAPWARVYPFQPLTRATQQTAWRSLLATTRLQVSLNSQSLIFISFVFSTISSIFFGKIQFLRQVFFSLEVDLSSISKITLARLKLREQG